MKIVIEIPHTMMRMDQPAADAERWAFADRLLTWLSALGAWGQDGWCTTFGHYAFVVSETDTVDLRCDDPQVQKHLDYLSHDERTWLALHGTSLEAERTEGPSCD